MKIRLLESSNAELNKIKVSSSVSRYFMARCLMVALAASCSLYTQKSHAQQSLSTEGIVGDVDQGRRAPVLTFSVEVASDLSSAKILADTQVINEDYRKFPIIVDFFVNGRLFSRQFRSAELPASLGIDVPREMAPIPFNYSIVATLQHTNRQYVTIAQGAVTEDMASISDKLSCTLSRTSDSLNIEGEISNTVSENKLKASFGEGTTATLDLSYTTVADSTTADVSGTVKIVDTTGTETSVNVTGTSEAAANTVSSLDLSSEGEDLTVNCEKSTTADTAAATASKDSSSVNDLESVIGTSTSGNTSTTSSGTNSAYGPNFVPLDQIGGVEEVN